MTIPSWLEAGAHEIVSPLGAGGMVVRLGAPADRASRLQVLGSAAGARPVLRCQPVSTVRFAAEAS